MESAGSNRVAACRDLGAAADDSGSGGVARRGAALALPPRCEWGWRTVAIGAR